MVQPMTDKYWAGTSLEDRRARRERQLLSASLDILGAQGELAVTVRNVCKVGRLNNRYFYESFDNPLELLCILYDEIAGELDHVVADAVADTGADLIERTHAGIAATIQYALADLRKGRVLFGNVLVHPQLLRRRQRAQEQWVRLMLTERVYERSHELPEARVGIAMYVGAVSELVRRCVQSDTGCNQSTELLARQVARHLLPAVSASMSTLKLAERN